MRGRATIEQRIRRGLTKRKIARRAFQYYKEIYHRLRGSSETRKKMVFIMGCQRSGTTLMYEIFAADLNTKVYSEFSKLTADWDGVNRELQIRLNDLDAVQRDLRNDAAPVIVIKPIVESQNSGQLLEFFSDSKILWMFRHYEDVIASDLKKFGIRNGIENLRPMVDNEPDNWRSENLPLAARELVLKHYSDDMSPYDAAALFWFVRNRFLFELGLDSNPRVLLTPYQRLVSDPVPMMNQIYEFIGCDYPGDHILKHVHAASLGKGRRIELSPVIRGLCDELLQELDHASARTWALAEPV